MKAFENETILAAMYANGVRVFSRSIKYHRPRGFFCAIGRCSSCMMEVDGVPNVRTCITKVKDGMHLRRQKTFADKFAPFLNLLNLSPLAYNRMFTKPGIIYKPAMKIIRQFTGQGSFSKKIEESGEEIMGIDDEFSTELLIVGGGPAGLSAALEAGQRCDDVIVIDDKEQLGGQLNRQTHMFFSDVKYAAGKRGFKLGKEMVEKISKLKTVRVLPKTNAIAYYPMENKMLMLRSTDRGLMVKAKKYIVAVGAYEKTLLFENNDLPGIYGAGGVQTLLNIYGVKPGKKGLMLGTGNVSLIVAYQLLQAGIGVEAIVAPSFRRVSGYLVHAAKIRRHGVPIITRHTILRALGKQRVTGALITELDEKYRPIEGTEKRLDCDFICMGVGLTPSYDLIQLFNPKMVYSSELGGFVPVRDMQFRFAENAYIAGDCGGVEEATTAVLEGGLAGLYAARSLGYADEEVSAKIDEYEHALEEDRGSPFSSDIKAALQKITVENIEEVIK
ncbi:MAG: (2Fe-2S)-binding protein [Thermoplasmata archaeon]|nr:MAG: (2Fe-2S)-binding protein [Thermoplasmata archaeon]